MTIIYPHGIEPDAATKLRTEEFFKLAKSKEIPDSTLAMLVQIGISPNAKLKDGGYTPLHSVIQHGKAEAVRCLLAAGAKPDTQNASGGTALSIAVFANHPAIIKILLDAGAQIEMRSNDGRTPLRWTALTDAFKAAEALIAAGAQIETRNKDGETALIAAAWKKHTATVMALLSRGANVYAQDCRGDAAIDSYRDSEVIDLQRLINQYQHFIDTREPPALATDVYHLLSVTPLVDPKAPVDYVGNLQRIFAHAKWKDKSHVFTILYQMEEDGTINAEAAASIIAAIFPPEHARHRSQPRSVGVAI